jgi:hypothetical protein
MVKQQSECHRHTHDINTMWIKEWLQRLD